MAHGWPWWGAALRRARTFAVAALIATIGGAAAPAADRADGRPFKPPDKRVFHGVSDTGDVDDFRRFRRQVDAHPAVLSAFYHWDTPLATGALQRWERTDTRGVLSLSTAPGGGTEITSPGRIAAGRNDDYILRLAESIKQAGQVVYIRLFPEMNGHWNPYCAYNADGTPRGSNHTTGKFRRAWKRFVLIARGGSRDEINHRLRRMKMPRIYRADANRDRVYRVNDVPRRLPAPRVAFMWNPQTVGSPNVPGNKPRKYWPGRRYVDWVGADIYSKYSSMMPYLGRFYRRWDHHPFFIGEYGPWDNDYTGAFTRGLFRWARDHRRTRMLVYYRSVTPDNIFNLQYYPDARSSLRRILDRQRYMQFAPGTHD